MKKTLDKQMDRWVDQELQRTSVIIPFPLTWCEDHSYVPISRSMVLVHKRSQIYRNVPDLPDKNSFWVVRATFDPNDHAPTSVALPLPKLRDTDRMQIIRFNAETKTLTVVLDDFDKDGKVGVMQFALLVPNKDICDGITWQHLKRTQNTLKRVKYRIVNAPPIINLDQYESRGWNPAEWKIYEETCDLLGISLKREFQSPTDGRHTVIASRDEYDWNNYTIKVTESADSRKVVSEFTRQIYNGGAELISGEFLLLSNGGEDYVGHVELVNWRKQETVKVMPWGYEWGWGHGLLPDSSIYFIGHGDAYGNGNAVSTCEVEFYGLPHI